MNDRQHILSVNLEDYFQVGPMRQVIPSRYWPRFDLRIEKSTLATLDLLDRTGAKATFFTIGWLAERCPDLIAEVSRRGHEVASKGYLHRTYAHYATPEEFRDDLLRSRDAIEAATGKAVLGYRIAEGSLPVDDGRPFRVLAEAGLRYDSSLRPFGPRFIGRGDLRRIHEVSGEGWSITEVPFSSGSFMGVPFPVSGGNYMRQMPRRLFENRLAARLAAHDEPWQFYFHTWELDSEQPRISATGRLARIRQYRNLEAMQGRIECLLGRLRFDGIADHLRLDPVAAPQREVARQTPQPSPAVPVRLRRRPTKATIVTPCFNEEETLPYLAGSLASLEQANQGVYDFSYVFVDDGSRDRTWDKLNELFGGRENVQLVRHDRNRGIAAATMTGIRAAKDEIVCGIDCDCSFDPHELARMIPLLTPDVDMVQASPYHRDGGVMNVPGWRLALSKGVCVIYRMILNHSFSSYTACFRVYRRSKMADLVIEDGGFMGIMEIFVRLDQSQARIVEFPAVLESRLIGNSKMKVLKVIGSHLRLIARLLAPQGGTAFAIEPKPKPHGRTQYES